MFNRQLLCVFFIVNVVIVRGDVFIPQWQDFYENQKATTQQESGSEVTTVGIAPLGDSELSKSSEEVSGNVAVPTLSDILSGGKTSVDHGNNTDFYIDETNGTVSHVGENGQHSIGANESEADDDTSNVLSSGELNTSGSNSQSVPDSTSVDSPSNDTNNASSDRTVHVCTTDIHNMTCSEVKVDEDGNAINNATSGNNAEIADNSNSASISSDSNNSQTEVVNSNTSGTNGSHSQSSNNTGAKSLNNKSDHSGHPSDSNKKDDSSSSSSEEDDNKSHKKNGDHGHNKH